ncbi:hypothetical protein AMATHDRAFT_72862 [Amanita thiersii Skay4041]|uniref:TRP C-terminal domain-containing protein n=1 Tax=Amanita thiersii Skay4041 TaxID=703135 RepID=A0A2A9P154_9AGAR|nr:hypothetical protein AMATHDRAFT_72862 [Amanita thiersii Skay4041]
MAIEPFLTTRPQRAFIATKAIVVLVMVAITFRLVDDKVRFTDGYKTLPCYLALFALAEVFELLMAFDALQMRNVIQLIGILFFHLALMIAAALQVHQTKTALVKFRGCDSTFNEINCDGPGTLWRRVEPFVIVAPCVIGASWLSLCYWFRELYAEFGWAIFHVVGANPKMKTMYRYYQIMICLLKFDFFCFTGVTMQLLIIVLHRDSAEFGVTIAAIPVVLMLLILCGLAVQREIRWIMSISLALMLASLTYLYKLVRFYSPVSREQYATTRATLTVFTIVAFLLLSATFVVGIRCFLDFDRGVLDSKVNVAMGQSPLQYQGGVPVSHRISIE